MEDEGEEDRGGTTSARFASTGSEEVVYRAGAPDNDDLVRAGSGDLELSGVDGMPVVADGAGLRSVSEDPPGKLHNPNVPPEPLLPLASCQSAFPRPVNKLIVVRSRIPVGRLPLGSRIGGSGESP